MHARDIADTGLRLAILNALLLLRRLDEALLRAGLAGIGDPHVEAWWEHEDEWIAAAIERLGEVEFDAAHLAQIRQIDFDGGNEIYMHLEEMLGIDTGGETDHYNLASLGDIGRLTELERLSLDGHGPAWPIDLTPLSHHPTLQVVHLSGRCTGTEALETLPALTRLRFGTAMVDAQVLARLAARGVQVSRWGR